MATGIHIGASKEAVDAAREAIMDIVESIACDHVKEKALEVFGKVCEVKNVTVSGCNITVPSD